MRRKIWRDLPASLGRRCPPTAWPSPASRVGACGSRIPAGGTPCTEWSPGVDWLDPAKEARRVAPRSWKRAPRPRGGDLTSNESESIRHRLTASPAIEAAVNNAFLDLQGKATKIPVDQFLGGPARFKARVLAGFDGENENALAAPLKRSLQQGFRAFTVSIPYSAPEGRLFVNPVTGKPYQQEEIQKRHIRKAGIDAKIGSDNGWHTCRHSYWSWLDETGALSDGHQASGSPQSRGGDA